MSIDHMKQLQQIEQPLIIIAGPTAGGKSALAMKFAERLNIEIVNADSMQIYKDLPILTAMPSAMEQHQVPHHGYGILDGAERCSMGRWLALTKDFVASIRARGNIPVLVGGTGLYIKSALEGIAPIPDIAPEYRQEATSLWQKLGGQAFRQLLEKYDALLAARLEDGDKQRLIRGMEVVLATGMPLSTWQEKPKKGKILGTHIKIAIMPPRTKLYDVINNRYSRMLAEGGIEEARRFAERNLPSDLPLMKAVGLPPLLRYFTGEIDRDKAIELACRDSRRYAKRQLTWFKHQFQGNLYKDSLLDEKYLECFLLKIFPKVIF